MTISQMLYFYLDVNRQVNIYIYIYNIYIYIYNIHTLIHIHMYIYIYRGPRAKPISLVLFSVV